MAGDTNQPLIDEIIDEEFRAIMPHQSVEDQLRHAITIVCRHLNRCNLQALEITADARIFHRHYGSGTPWIKGVGVAESPGRDSPLEKMMTRSEALLCENKGYGAVLDEEVHDDERRPWPAAGTCWRFCQELAAWKRIADDLEKAMNFCGPPNPEEVCGIGTNCADGCIWEKALDALQKLRNPKEG